LNERRIAVIEKQTKKNKMNNNHFKEFIKNILIGNALIEDETLKIQYLILNSFSIIGASFAFILGILHLFSSNASLGIFDICGFIFTISTITFLRKTKKINICSDIILGEMLLLFIFLLWFNKNNTSLFWFYTFPPLAIFLKGYKKGFIWVSAEFLIIIGFFLSEKLRIISSMIFTDMQIFIMTMSLLAVTILIFFYEMLKLKLINVIKKQESEIVKKKIIEEEYLLAEKIQKALIPDKDIILNNLEISGYYHPANGVGGDYYDYVDIRDGKTAVIICDVSGKGVPSAIVMVNIRSVFLNIIQNPDIKPDEIIKIINSKMCCDLTTDMFATLSVFIYNSKTNEVSICNAGHGPFIYYSKKDNAIHEIPFNNLPSGISKDEINYTNRFVTLGKGDVILSFTDGLTEAYENKFKENAVTIIKENFEKLADLYAGEINDRLIGKIEDVIGKMKINDDISLVVSKLI
jgi:hypothetical protein